MKPLTTKQRSKSLFILIALFIITAPVILLYSFGYRLSDTYSFEKTGGIFIHSDITNSSVFVDDKFFKNNGIFVRNVLIQDLTPNKTYAVRIQKEGFQSWVKKLYVSPSIVSEGKALLLPDQIESREIQKYIDDKKVATSTSIVKGAKPNNPEYLATLELFSTSTKATSSTPIVTKATSTQTETAEKSDIELFFDSLAIKNFEKLQNLIVRGKDVSWLTDGNINLYWTDELSSIPYYFCDEEDRTCDTKITLDWSNPVIRFAYLPGRDDIWVVLVRDGIYAVEVDGRTQRNIQIIKKADNLDFRITDNDRIMIKEGSKYFEIDL